MKTVLKNGKIIIRDNDLELVDIAVESGKIIEMGHNLTGDTVIDLDGKLVMPGLVDVHVHLREPGFTDKETIKTGSMAAARGGFTTICAMPNTNPIPDTVEKFQAIEAIITQDAVVNVLHYAPITNGLRSDELVDMKAINAFAYTNDGVGVQTAGTMYKAMKAAAAIGKPIVAHTEDESLLYDGVMHEGRRSKALELPGIMGIVESSQIARDILIAKETGCHYHVCHVSSKESVAAIRFGKELGVHVTAEVSPHHLILNEMDIPGDDANYKMNPPLRSAEDQKALIEGLLDGTLDIIATDHAPHTVAEKKQGFLKAPFGITGSEIAFPLIYTEFVEKGIFTLAQVQKWMSHKPAEIFNFKNKELTVGSIADIAVFDIDSTEVVHQDDFVSKAINTPFIGRELKGNCKLTMVEGEIRWNVI
ncbi:dihydroorotase [Erysipelothrix sp. HDW6C]|uniref:dihydroorotase n=1 Tax=Erysipelothrix sp. HDW6C TaxID=2714930 RepID=UPI00140DA9E5|nr:dihydroorotase [Erysipelothrix sp. HDW6C]QIK69121.1 dihydroorotase [Erysipelothrix sp. HDW6C]